MKDLSTLRTTIETLLSQAVESERSGRIYRGLILGIDRAIMSKFGYTEEEVHRVLDGMLSARLHDKDYDPATYDLPATLCYVSGYVKGLVISHHEYKRAEEREKIIRNVANFNCISTEFAERVIDGETALFNPFYTEEGDGEPLFIDDEDEDGEDAGDDTEEDKEKKEDKDEDQFLKEMGLTEEESNNKKEDPWN